MEYNCQAILLLCVYNWRILYTFRRYLCRKVELLSWLNPIKFTGSTSCDLLGYIKHTSNNHTTLSCFTCPWNFIYMYLHKDYPPPPNATPSTPTHTHFQDIYTCKVALVSIPTFYDRRATDRVSIPTFYDRRATDLVSIPTFYDRRATDLVSIPTFYDRRATDLQLFIKVTWKMLVIWQQRFFSAVHVFVNLWKIAHLQIKIRLMTRVLNISSEIFSKQHH